MRNKPCPCGSGKKFKNCCQRKDRPPPPANPNKQQKFFAIGFSGDGSSLAIAVDDAGRIPYLRTPGEAGLFAARIVSHYPEASPHLVIWPVTKRDLEKYARQMYLDLVLSDGQGNPIDEQGFTISGPKCVFSFITRELQEKLARERDAKRNNRDRDLSDRIDSG